MNSSNLRVCGNLFSGLLLLHLSKDEVPISRGVISLNFFDADNLIFIIVTKSIFPLKFKPRTTINVTNDVNGSTERLTNNDTLSKNLRILTKPLLTIQNSTLCVWLLLSTNSATFAIPSTGQSDYCIRSPNRLLENNSASFAFSLLWCLGMEIGVSASPKTWT